MADDADMLEPTVQHLLRSPTLRWIFVGGKGGVGKTTTSSSLALLLSQSEFPSNPPRPRRVLVVSTDPAHNIADAFDQAVGSTPTPIRGVANLWAMELDHKTMVAAEEEMPATSQMDSFLSSMGIDPAAVRPLVESSNKLKDVVGVVEELALIKAIVAIADNPAFDSIVFDTAPTGHTLKLLALPSVSDSLTSLSSMGASLQGMLKNFLPGLGGDAAGGQQPFDLAGRGMGETVDALKRFSAVIHDPTATQFVCVCIAESLSVYETERLVQALAKEDISVETVICNMLLMRGDEAPPCDFCTRRVGVQQRYREQVRLLYGDLFHLVELPLLPCEVRGVDGLRQTAAMLAKGYDPNKPPPVLEIKPN